MNKLYGYMSGYVNSYKWASRTGAVLVGESGFTKFMARAGNFLWWLSYLVASFLFTYVVFGWNFLNVKFDSVLLIVSIVSVIVFSILAVCGVIDKNISFKEICGRNLSVSTWLSIIFSFLLGTTITVLFALVASYIISLSSSLTIIFILLSLQIPYFLNAIISLFFGGWLKYKYTEQTTEEYDDERDKRGRYIKGALVIIVEVLMIAFVVYFGALPYFKVGGLEAIRDKALGMFKGKDTITLLFGSNGIIVAGVSALGAIISTIFKIVRKRRD